MVFMLLLFFVLVSRISIFDSGLYFHMELVCFQRNSMNAIYVRQSVVHFDSNFFNICHKRHIFVIHIEILHIPKLKLNKTSNPNRLCWERRKTPNFDEFFSIVVGIWHVFNSENRTFLARIWWILKWMCS